MSLHIFNLKYGWQSDAVLVDRSSPWGNPFQIGRDGNRDEVCDLFETYAVDRLAREPEWLDKLRGRDLVCRCRDDRYPRGSKRCHAETLLRLANDQG